MTSISQVLLFGDHERSLEFGPMLWAVLREIEAFYNHDEPRATFHNVYIAPQVPSLLQYARIAHVEDQYQSIREPFWRQARGSLTRTFDARKIIEGVTGLLGSEVNQPPYLIITDQELTPPPEWRYIVFDGDGKSNVVSIRPTDPAYWGERTPSRMAIIKRRVRAAGLTAAGMMVGLKRCETPQCFLYGSVDSVTCLDGMVKLCSGHDLPNLAGYGFPTAPADPSAVQPVTRNPQELEIL